METDKNFSVLIVSSDYVVLDIIGSILLPYYSVERVTSTNEALNMLKSKDINLIVIDYSFKSKDCSDFFANIKSDEETMNIPSVLIGDASSPEEEERAFALGAVDYISKPFRTSIVKIRINNQRLLVKHIKAIEELGMLDPLTGIYNRRGFDNRIRLEWLRAIREKTTLCLAVADVDHFKTYNDSYGHAQGDVLLRVLAKQFVSMIRRPADFVGRWGGEEFVIMLPRTELEGAHLHLEEIRKSVEDMQMSHNPFATISIGVASIVPTADSSIEAFFSQADKALYNAKNSGRNKVCVFG